MAAHSLAEADTRFVPADDPRLARLMRWAGVTRAAMVTGLDRTGVPVACAVRPGGHVLQVTNGKGVTARAAAWSAVVEAVELQVSEAFRPEESVFGAAGVLSTRAQLLEVAGGSAGGEVDPALRAATLVQAWRRGRELSTGAEVLIPAAAVHCPPPGAPLAGPASVSWTSNGLGAGDTLAAATAHALCEVLERDQLARAFPEGWTREAIRGRAIPSAWLERRAPVCARWVSQLRSRGFEVFLFQVEGPPSRPPVAAAVLVDTERGPVPLSAGYACRLNPADALLAALLEAAQSRATDIHGAREDIEPMPAEDVEALAVLCRAAPASVPSWRPTTLARALRGLTSEGAGPIAAVTLTREEDPVQVVKVVAPRLLSTELL